MINPEEPGDKFATMVNRHINKTDDQKLNIERNTYRGVLNL